MIERKRKKLADGPRVNMGRTFADRDRPTRWYVVLAVDHVWSLVWWENGRVRTIPLARMGQLKIRIAAFDFSMEQLLARWRIDSKTVDRYMEEHIYRWDPDVINVRATRRPLTGRTIEHVRHRHPDPIDPVGGL